MQSCLQTIMVNRSERAHFAPHPCRHIETNKSEKRVPYREQATTVRFLQKYALQGGSPWCLGGGLATSQ